MSMFPDGIENAIGSVIKDNGFISGKRYLKMR